jgi:hypothetical protein
MLAAPLSAPKASGRSCSRWPRPTRRPAAPHRRADPADLGRAPRAFAAQRRTPVRAGDPGHETRRDPRLRSRQQPRAARAVQRRRARVLPRPLAASDLKTSGSQPRGTRLESPGQWACRLLGGPPFADHCRSADLNHARFRTTAGTSALKPETPAKDEHRQHVRLCADARIHEQNRRESAGGSDCSPSSNSAATRPVEVRLRSAPFRRRAAALGRSNDAALAGSRSGRSAALGGRRAPQGIALGALAL